MGLRPVDGGEEEVAGAGRAGDQPVEVVALGAVVTEDDEDGVLVLADLLQVVDELADVEVQVLQNTRLEPR